MKLGSPEFLRSYDIILVNTSGGKDSQAMIGLLYHLAKRAGVTERLVAVHADLGRVEWAGTKALARRQAQHYGIRFEWMARPPGEKDRARGATSGDLLEQVRTRGMWPDSQNRFCTSDQKRGQISKIMRILVDEIHQGRPIKILSCMGFRAAESHARKKRPVLSRDNGNTYPSRRVVDIWLPIHEWSDLNVWRYIRREGTPYHPAYDMGMPRLSCVFCVFAPEAALWIAGKKNPKLLDEYCAVERIIKHDFQPPTGPLGRKTRQPISRIRDMIRRGERPKKMSQSDWNM